MTHSKINIRQPSEPLTPRENEVLTLTAYGKTRSEIGHILEVSEETVKTHLEHACIKLCAVNKTHAATIAIVLGLIAPYRNVELVKVNLLSMPNTKNRK